MRLIQKDDGIYVIENNFARTILLFFIAFGVIIFTEHILNSDISIAAIVDGLTFPILGILTYKIHPKHPLVVDTRKRTIIFLPYTNKAREFSFDQITYVQAKSRLLINSLQFGNNDTKTPLFVIQSRKSNDIQKTADEILKLIRT